VGVDGRGAIRWVSWVDIASQKHLTEFVGPINPYDSEYSETLFGVISLLIKLSCGISYENSKLSVIRYFPFLC